MKIALRFTDKFYTGSGLLYNERIAKWRLKNFVFIKDMFVLMLPENETGQLEIMKASYLKQDYYIKNPPLVVGCTGSQEEAVEIVMRLVDEQLKRTGDASIRECFGK